MTIKRLSYQELREKYPAIYDPDGSGVDFEAQKMELRYLRRLTEAERKLEKCRGTLREIIRYYAKAEASVARELARSALREIFGE